MRRLGTTIVLLALSAVCALAAESRIPITAPTVINTGGAYVLTRDVFGPPLGSAIIVSAGDVTLDLNGHTIWGTPGGYPVEIRGACHVNVRNGHLSGGTHGVYIHAATGTIAVDVAGMQIDGQIGWGIEALAATRLSITDTSISSMGAVHVVANVPDAQTRIVGNTFRATQQCVALDANVVQRGAVIEGNSIISDAGVALSLIDLQSGALVRRNTLYGGGGQGIYVNGAGGHVLEGNVVRDAPDMGIQVEADGVRIVGNTVTGSGQNGILIDGRSCSIESNIAAGNGNVGIDVVGPGNVYRNNTARGNGNAPYDIHPGNTDGGGNY